MPERDCSRCPRLVAFRRRNAASYPDWHNAPVPSFGPPGARLLIVGLAPGLRGANRTGRPFTGDYAGDLLYATLRAFGFGSGTYAARPDDGFQLVDCRIVNAVRCVPPENKPTTQEIITCNPFLRSELMHGGANRGIVALGMVAHRAVLRALDLVAARYPFAHGACHPLPDGRWLVDSYHCSRYNTNTGRLTEAMFREVFATIRAKLDAEPSHRADAG